jgi:hypothetical protein
VALVDFLLHGLGRWPVTVPGWVQGLGFVTLVDFLVHGSAWWWWSD